MRPQPSLRSEGQRNAALARGVSFRASDAAYTNLEPDDPGLQDLYRSCDWAAAFASAARASRSAGGSAINHVAIAAGGHNRDDPQEIIGMLDSHWRSVARRIVDEVWGPTLSVLVDQAQTWGWSEDEINAQVKIWADMLREHYAPIVAPAMLDLLVEEMVVRVRRKNKRAAASTD